MAGVIKRASRVYPTVADRKLAIPNNMRPLINHGTERARTLSGGEPPKMRRRSPSRSRPSAAMAARLSSIRSACSTRSAPPRDCRTRSSRYRPTAAKTPGVNRGSITGRISLVIGTSVKAESTSFTRSGVADQVAVATPSAIISDVEYGRSNASMAEGTSMPSAVRRRFLFRAAQAAAANTANSITCSGIPREGFRRYCIMFSQKP